MQLRATRLTCIAHAVRRVIASFSPLQLFSANEPGIWLDPSDPSTMFQDAAGTTPVTAVEQPVGLILDKSRGLVLGPELVDTANTASAWVPYGTNTVTQDGDAVRINYVDNSGGALLTLNGTGGLLANVVVEKTYVVQFQSRVSAGASVNINLSSTNSGTIATTISSADYVTTTLRVSFTGTSPLIWQGASMSAGESIWIRNISVRELPGNHATQATATARPVLSARANLLTKSEQFDDGGWIKQDGLVSVTPNAGLAPDGTFTADLATWTGNASLYQPLATGLLNGIVFTASIYIKGTAGQTINFWPDMGNLGSRTTVTLTGSWQYISLSGTGGAVAHNFAIRKEATTANSVYIWGASLVPANQASLPYQRVNTASDYDAGPAFPRYLRFDGIDDSLVTGTITPGTDKVQVFAGVRKLSDAATAIVVELSANAGANNGSFYVAAPGGSGQNTYHFINKGTGIAGIAAAGFAAPTTDVVTGIGDISGDSTITRANGSQATSSTADLGSGNYLAYPLYIGRRNNATLPANINLYQLVTRFGPNLSIETIQQTETFFNQKTGAY